MRSSNTQVTRVDIMPRRGAIKIDMPDKGVGELEAQGYEGKEGLTATRAGGAPWRRHGDNPTRPER